MKDPGLQRERTGLAWSRTGFLMMLVALLSVRGGLSHFSFSQLLAALLLSGTSGLLLYRGHQRSRYEDGTDEVVAEPSRRLAAVTGMVVFAVALLHAISVLLRLLHHFAG
ncbi:DUF202 domain-containing protein [Xanthobacter aminoxidans]|uniref:DUF202 domain-containing protein n=1 Tax=Xanthobacter aminoxidans TaxID=186280 RepID=UPI002022C4B5|nr:DUF202 domain-containing protein [Xanthobacter aminoxidans]MCL8383913.1 DUF202 domain-containing protein [Xanthobacter aminoxidans]